MAKFHWSRALRGAASAGVLLMCLGTGLTAFGQNGRIAFHPPDAPPAAAPTTPVPPAPADAEKKDDEKKDDEKKDEEEKKEEEETADAPKCDFLQHLFDDRCGNNCFTDHGIVLGGNIAQGVTFNPQSPADRFNGPVTWTDRANEYQMNQLYLHAEKATDTKDKDWDFGGKVGMIYGTNYRWSTTAGLEDRWGMNTAHSFYGMAVIESYLEVAHEDVKVKVGRFTSPVGYFVVDTAQNFFNTLPYTYQYGEPFTHWGGLATWTVDEHLSIGQGCVYGWDNFNGMGAGADHPGWVGTATYTWDDKSSLAWVGLATDEWNNGGTIDNHSWRYFQTLVYQKPLDDNWTYVAQSDFGTQSHCNDFSGTRSIGTARWYGLNQYLFYKCNDQWTWGANFEWFRDESGFRVGNLLPTLSAPIGSQVRGLPTDRFGYQGNFYQCTVGPKWTPCDCLMVRPNLRFDWFDGDSLNPGALRPYNGGRSNNQCILGTDVVVTF